MTTPTQTHWRPQPDGIDTLTAQDRAALSHLDGAAPASGGRRAALRGLAHAMARLGATNHEIVQVLEERADAWGVLPRKNLWARYNYILTQVADARAALNEGT